VRRGEVRPLQVRRGEVRPLQVRRGEVRPFQVRLAEARPYQMRPAEVRSDQVRSAEVRPLQPCLGPAHPREIRFAQLQPRAVRVLLDAPTTDDGGDGLVVHRQGSDRRRGRPDGDISANRRVFAEVSVEHLHDRPVQLGGVERDLLQGVDAAQPGGQAVGAELLDGLG
jgi:hypothetical protein